MKNKSSIIGFLEETFMIFGFTITVVNLFCLLFGEGARGFSTMFSLGSDGLSVRTAFDFLLLSAIIAALREIFFTGRFIKEMSMTLRTVCMFSLIILVMVGFVALRGWFPIDNALAWVMFAVCFIVSVLISAAVSSAKEKSENRKMSEALERFKKGEN